MNLDEEKTCYRRTLRLLSEVSLHLHFDPSFSIQAIMVW